MMVGSPCQLGLNQRLPIVYLGVKTCEFFLFSSYYFPWLYCADFSVASLYSLLYVTRESHRFLQRGAQLPDDQ